MTLFSDCTGARGAARIAPWRAGQHFERCTGRKSAAEERPWEARPTSSVWHDVKSLNLEPALEGSRPSGSRVATGHTGHISCPRFIGSLFQAANGVARACGVASGVSLISTRRSIFKSCPHKKQVPRGLFLFG